MNGIIITSSRSALTRPSYAYCIDLQGYAIDLH